MLTPLHCAMCILCRAWPGLTAGATCATRPTRPSWACCTASCHLTTSKLLLLTAVPQGLAWIDSWGNLRYVANQAFMGLLHGKLYPEQSRRATVYTCFARKQARLMLGVTGQGYVVSAG